MTEKNILAYFNNPDEAHQVAEKLKEFRGHGYQNRWV